jgi:hypothetical protein
MPGVPSDSKNFPAVTNGPQQLPVAIGQPGYTISLLASDSAGIKSLSMNLMPQRYPASTSGGLGNDKQVFSTPPSEPLPLILQSNQSFQQSDSFTPTGPDKEVPTAAALLLTGFNWSCGTHQFNGMPKSQEFFVTSGSTATFTGTATDFFGHTVTSTIVFAAN